MGTGLPAVLCLTSHQAQSVRAVVVATLPGGGTVVGASDPIKFSSDPWYKSTAFTGPLLAFLGAIFGVCGTLYTQNHERRRKAEDELRSAALEQEQFLVRNLFPELASHLQILAENEALTAADTKNAQPLPKKDLVTLANGPRARKLAAYFGSLRLKADVVAALTKYSADCDRYATAAEGVARGRMTLDEFKALGRNLHEQLVALGFSE